MNLSLEISEWDGKSAADIGKIYDQHGQQPLFTATLIMLIEKAPFQKGATWLLKKHFESGGSPDEKQTEKVYSLLPLLENWEAKLHILQSIPHMLISSTSKQIVVAFINDTLKSSKKTVRAWSYNGFYELAMQHAEYKKEAVELLKVAEQDESASVKARIRNILKKGF